MDKLQATMLVKTVIAGLGALKAKPMTSTNLSALEDAIEEFRVNLPVEVDVEVAMDMMITLDELSRVQKAKMKAA